MSLASRFAEHIFDGINQDVQNRYHHLSEKYNRETVIKSLANDPLSYESNILAGRLLLSDLYSNTPTSYLDSVRTCQSRYDRNPEIVKFIELHADDIQSVIESNFLLDLNNDHFTARNYIDLYSMRPHPQEASAEVPQYTYMRIAIQIHYRDGLDRVIEKYLLYATKTCSAATPVFFGACVGEQLASCNLLTCGDNKESILYEIAGDASVLLAQDAGVGIDLSRIRYSTIANKKKADGVPALCRKLNGDITYIKREKTRRGAATIYLPTHHGQVEEFLRLHDENGDASDKAFGIFTSLWTSWNFWDRLYKKEPWYGFCPKLTSDLNDLTGVQFTHQYDKYVATYENTDRKVRDAEINVQLKTKMPEEEKQKLRREREFLQLTKKFNQAEDVLSTAISIMRQNGTPFIGYGDAAHLKSNQRHQGKLRQSNLCTEIIQRTCTPEHESDYVISSCNLGSINLAKLFKKKYAKDSKLVDCINFELCREVTQASVENCDRLIDYNVYPLESNPYKPVSRPNLEDRPISVGVCGFADLFYQLDIIAGTKEGYYINKVIFACMYWNALVQSLKLALIAGPYPTFAGSPMSEGKFQFDLWAEEFAIRGPNRYRRAADDKPIDPKEWGQKEIYLDIGNVQLVIQPNWQSLREAIMQHGIRNSLLIGLMPTATSSNVLGASETTEFMSVLNVRSLLNGNFYQINKYFVWDMQRLNVWNLGTYYYILYHRTIQGFEAFVKYCMKNKVKLNGKQLYTEYVMSELRHIERKYRSMKEIDPSVILKLAADRGRYICQSQSLNLYFYNKTDRQIKAYYMMAEMLGIKTTYYSNAKEKTDDNKVVIPPAFKLLFTAYNKKEDLEFYNAIVNEIDIQVDVEAKSEETEECLKCSS